jgi:hypothetical protein
MCCVHWLIANQKNNFITTDPFVRKQDSQFFCKKNPNRIDFFRFGPFFVFPCLSLFFFLLKLICSSADPSAMQNAIFSSLIFPEEKMQTMTDQLLVDLYIKSEKK